MTKSSETRAMRRSGYRDMTAESKLRLEAVDRAGQEGIVLDEDVVPLPAEDGAVTFSLEYLGASLNWNMDWMTIDQTIVSAEAGLCRIGRAKDHRALAREIVIQSLLNDTHLEAAAAKTVASMAVWLMFTGENGALLRKFGLRHAGYVITGTPKEANFRLVAGT